MFNVYDEHSILVFEPVLMGLSKGEVSQTIISLAEQDFSSGDNNNIFKKIHSIVQSTGNVDVKKIFSNNILTKEVFEDIIYLLNDDDLLGKWVFSEKIIYILEDS